MTNVTIKGNTPNMVYIDSSVPDLGRYINEPDNERRRDVAMIGVDVADKLFNKREVVGRDRSVWAILDAKSRWVRWSVYYLFAVAFAALVLTAPQHGAKPFIYFQF